MGSYPTFLFGNIIQVGTNSSHFVWSRKNVHFRTWTLVHSINYKENISYLYHINYKQF